MPGSEYPKFITECTEDEEGNLCFEIPDELLTSMGWKEGTVIDIDIIGERVILREVQRSDLDQTP
jgi:hypothetical protein